MPPRFYCPMPLVVGAHLSLPAGAARHVQVLRLQPADMVTLFNDQGGQYSAAIVRMGRAEVTVCISAHEPREVEAVRRVHLALGMPANDRMDWLIEKAAELGVASVQPLHTAHSVLRLTHERALKKQAHWQAVAAAACEQCGANRVPLVQPVADLSAWLGRLTPLAGASAASTDHGPIVLRYVLSLAPEAQPLAVALAHAPADAAVWCLSGPEGGLNEHENAAAGAAGFVPVSLGPRVLRAETAALAALVLAVSAP